MRHLLLVLALIVPGVVWGQAAGPAPRIVGGDSTGAVDAVALVRAAIAALPSEGGKVILPRGIFRFASPLVITASNVTVEGEGLDATTIIGDLALGNIVQIGNASTVAQNVAIRNLTVTRAPGTPPDGSASISWCNFGYGVESNTLAQNSYYARVVDACGNTYNSIGYRADHIIARNAVQAYMRVINAADVFVAQSDMGHNGAETYTPHYSIEISGQANDVSFSESIFIQRGPTANSGSVIGFTNYANTTGIIRLSGILSENTAYFIQSDANTPTITQLFLDNSRIAIAVDFSNLNSATQLQYSHITGTDVGGGSTTLTNTRAFRITGGSNLQALNLSGITATGGTPNDALVTDSYLGNVSISGIFAYLTFANNVLSSGAAFSDTSAATNKIMQRSNSYSTGASNLGFGTTNGIGITILDPGGLVKNPVSFQPGLTTKGPLMYPSGESNIPLLLSANGSSSVALMSNSGTTNSFQASSPAGGVNYWYTIGGISGNSTTLGVGGGDANVDGIVQARGNGKLNLNSPVALAGHILASGNTPTLSSCGTLPTISGSDNAGLITTGESATSCTMTFQTAYVNPPYCVVTGQSSAVTYSSTAAALTIATTAAVKINYQCIGQSGG